MGKSDIVQLLDDQLAVLGVVALGTGSAVDTGNEAVQNIGGNEGLDGAGKAAAVDAVSAAAFQIMLAQGQRHRHILVGLIAGGDHILQIHIGRAARIVYDIQKNLRADVEFIAAHPMAGREVSGVENSTDKLFIGANYIITPTEKNTPEAIQTCLELGRLLGFSNITTLSPEEHDEMIGFLSQLTHCIAITLMTCNDKENMEKFTGDSFRDLTRIARINDLMWSELFVANKDVLLDQMNMFVDKFNELKTMLETEDIDGMRAMMRHSTERRALFDKK